jgi:hypothetical protein
VFMYVSPSACRACAGVSVCMRLSHTDGMGKQR